MFIEVQGKMIFDSVQFEEICNIAFVCAALQDFLCLFPFLFTVAFLNTDRFFV